MENIVNAVDQVTLFVLGLRRESPASDDCPLSIRSETVLPRAPNTISWWVKTYMATNKIRDTPDLNLMNPWMANPTDPDQAIDVIQELKMRKWKMKSEHTCDSGSIMSKVVEWITIWLFSLQPFWVVVAFSSSSTIELGATTRQLQRHGRLTRGGLSRVRMLCRAQVQRRDGPGAF